MKKQDTNPANPPIPLQSGPLSTSDLPPALPAELAEPQSMDIQSTPARASSPELGPSSLAIDPVSQSTEPPLPRAVVGEEAGNKISQYHIEWGNTVTWSGLWLLVDVGTLSIPRDSPFAPNLSLIGLSALSAIFSIALALYLYHSYSSMTTFGFERIMIAIQSLVSIALSAFAFIFAAASFTLVLYLHHPTLVIVVVAIVSPVVLLGLIARAIRISRQWTLFFTN